MQLSARLLHNLSTRSFHSNQGEDPDTEVIPMGCRWYLSKRKEECQLVETGVEERAFQVEGTAWAKAWEWESEEHVQCWRYCSK